MSDYTFSSKTPNFFHEIHCPILNHNKISWSIKSIIGSCNIKVIDEEDFIIFSIHEQLYEIRPEIAYFDLSNENEGFLSWLSDKLEEFNIKYQIDGGGRWSFYSTEKFEIIDCSYYFKQIFGLYFLNEFPLHSINNAIKIQASGLKLGSSFWFLTCNCSSSSSNVVMRIFNDFSPNKTFQVNNHEFNQISNAGSLSQLIIQIVDENLHPIRFTNPIFIYIQTQEIFQENICLEPFRELPPNPILKEKIQRKRIQNKEKKEKALRNLGRYDPTADRENEDLEFPLKTPEQEENELRMLRRNISRDNKERESLIEELQENYQEQNQENKQEDLPKKDDL
jgi:hypothetical protein